MDVPLIENFLIAMIAILNPLGKVPIWVEAEAGCDRPTRIRLAFLITMTALLVLAVALFFGDSVLSFLGIDVPAFRVGGGIILLRLGIDMLGGKSVSVDDRDGADGESAFDRAKGRYRQVVIPMAIPILAGPGSITTVILFGSGSQDWPTRFAQAGVLGAAMLAVFGVLMSGQWIRETVGELVLEVQTRIWGLLLTAIAAQLILVGLAQTYPSWIQGSLPNQGLSPMMDDATQTTPSG